MAETFSICSSTQPVARREAARRQTRFPVDDFGKAKLLSARGFVTNQITANLHSTIRLHKYTQVASVALTATEGAFAAAVSVVLSGILFQHNF